MAVETLTRRRWIGAVSASFCACCVGGLSLAATPVLVHDDQDQVKSLPFQLRGRFVQSGFCVGKTRPGSTLSVDGIIRGQVSQTGIFYVGFDRDAGPSCLIETHRGPFVERARLAIAPMSYDVQRVDGLPPDMVSPTDPALLTRIKNEVDLKTAAFSSRVDADWFKDGFVYPFKDFVISGRFGNQRILDGVPKSPHMGFDMAAPVGTPIHAPQRGLVVLAEPDLFYEGGLVLIDHGQGVISMYLHQSKIIARKGDLVSPGDVIGEVGAKGRATGPHLCWRLKWTDRHMDPSLMVA